MKNMNKQQAQETLLEINLKPKKSLGQNFLIDPRVVNKIITTANLNKDDIILEVGTGLGALTTELSLRVKKVYSYEIDYKLFQYISKKVSSISNIEFIHGDILKSELPNHNKIVSNIPYTITGPLFEKVFYNEHPPEGTLIIEKSIADRIFNPEDYKKFSRISVSFNAFMNPVKKLKISSKSFYPSPRIELSLIKVKKKENVHPFLLEKKNKTFFLNFVAGIIPYKNKNMINALELFLKNKTEGPITRINLLIFLKDHNISNLKLFKFKTDELIEICVNLFSWLNI